MGNYINSAPMALVVVLLVVGFVFLVKGADFFVEGSSSVAKRFHVPSLIIGLTIVAMGTSLPETAVSVTASLVDNNALAVSNAVGSNIFNLMVVIGFCAVLTPVAVDKQTLKRDFPFSVLCAVILLAFGFIGMELGHVDGVVLLVLFAVYIVVLVRVTLKHKNKAESELEEETEEIKLLSMPRSLLYMVVDTASRIAIDFGMSQTLVGLTIVSIGTSLPELVTSIVAAKKNEVDMALGNAIGSNVFNFLMVLGIASAISPIAFITENIIDIIVLIVFSIIVWIMAWTKSELKRGEGFLMLIMYIAYAVYIIMR